MNRDDCCRLINICRGKHIYIQTHNFPDPDAIASAFGLQRLLQHYGIMSTLCYYGKIDKLSTRKMTTLFNIELSPYEEIVDKMSEKDYIICVDSQKSGGNIKDFIGSEIACIDHHPVYNEVEYQYCDIRMVGSCSTLIAQYYKVLGVEPDSDTASALLYGLKMDTLQFTRGVTELDIQMFEFVFPRVNAEKMSALEKNTMEFDDLMAYGAAIENIQIYEKVGFAKIPFSCPDFLIAIIADFILNLHEVEVAVIYSDRDDGIKFSVRSEVEGIHAGDMTNYVLKDIGNGGGHPTMAGGLIAKETALQLGDSVDSIIMDRFLKYVFECKTV